MSQNLDNRIRDALGAEDARLFAADSEMTLREGMAASFKGKQRGWVMLIWPMTFLTWLGWMICLVQFFLTDDTNTRLAWGLIAVMFMLATGLLKMWYFLELNKLNVLREIKRVELQVAALAESAGAE